MHVSLYFLIFLTKNPFKIPPIIPTMINAAAIFPASVWLNPKGEIRYELKDVRIVILVPKKEYENAVIKNSLFLKAFFIPKMKSITRKFN